MRVIEPVTANIARYDALYALYRALYPALKPIYHRLSGLSRLFPDSPMQQQERIEVQIVPKQPAAKERHRQIVHPPGPDPSRCLRGRHDRLLVE